MAAAAAAQQLTEEAAQHAKDGDISAAITRYTEGLRALRCDGSPPPDASGGFYAATSSKPKPTHAGASALWWQVRDIEKEWAEDARQVCLGNIDWEEDCDVLGVFGGPAMACHLYAGYCKRGWGVTKDVEAGLRWLARAAELGCEGLPGLKGAELRDLAAAYQSQLREQTSGSAARWAVEAALAPELCAELLLGRSICWSKAAASGEEMGRWAVRAAALADAAAAAAIRPAWGRAHYRLACAGAVLHGTRLANLKEQDGKEVAAVAEAGLLEAYRAAAAALALHSAQGVEQQKIATIEGGINAIGKLLAGRGLLPPLLGEPAPAPEPQAL